jgi:hypothetical protein
MECPEPKMFAVPGTVTLTAAAGTAIDRTKTTIGKRRRVAASKGASFAVVWGVCAPGE